MAVTLADSPLVEFDLPIRDTLFVLSVVSLYFATPTIVSFPATATPGGWNWRYGGYGTPASGDRNTAEAVDLASWRFLMPEAANLNDPDPDDTLTGEGPILFTQFNDAGSEPRTLDQVIADLDRPAIDWSQPVTLTMQVKARWAVGGNFVGSFSSIRQGILLFDYDDGGSVGTVIDANFAPGDNDTWQDVSVELVGQDAGGAFLLGMFGSVDFEPIQSPLQDRSPQLEFFFDDLRLNYTNASEAPATPVSTLSNTGLLLLALLLLGVAWVARWKHRVYS